MPKLRYPLIGIGGRAKAGKSTVCAFACQHLERVAKHSLTLALADPLKEVCLRIFGPAYGVEFRQLYGTQADKNEPLAKIPGWTGRKIAQHIGTEGFRYIAPEVWGRYLLAAADAQLRGPLPPAAIFVSDVRFPDEAKSIREAGGAVVKMVRPSLEGTTTEGLAGHASEAHVDEIEYDFMINNQDRSLQDLDDRVYEMLEHFELLDKGN